MQSLECLANVYSAAAGLQRAACIPCNAVGVREHWHKGLPLAGSLVQTPTASSNGHGRGRIHVIMAVRPPLIPGPLSEYPFPTTSCIERSTASSPTTSIHRPWQHNQSRYSSSSSPRSATPSPELSVAASAMREFWLAPQDVSYSYRAVSCTH